MSGRGTSAREALIYLLRRRTAKLRFAYTQKREASEKRGFIACCYPGGGDAKKPLSGAFFSMPSSPSTTGQMECCNSEQFVILHRLICRAEKVCRVT